MRVVPMFIPYASPARVMPTRIRPKSAGAGVPVESNTIFPAIVLSGPYQNVSAAAADNAVIKIFGSATAYANLVTKQGLAFHKEWMTAAFVDLDLPKNMEMSARAKSNKLGIAIRIVKGYDIRTNQQLCRLDVLFGLKQMYEDFCCRIAGS